MNIFHHSAAWIAKHKRHHHVALATLALILAASGVYTYRHEFASAATYAFTQSSWAGGISATTATHTSNQTNWTQYSTGTGIVAGSDITISATTHFLTDDDATSTNSTSFITGGTFGAGTNSNTSVQGNGKVTLSTQP